MSASTMPTRRPLAARAAARLTVTEDLPTPPLPEAIAKTRMVVPGWAKGMTGSAPPRSWSRSALRWASSITSVVTVTSSTPSSSATAAYVFCWRVSRIGQPAMVR